MRKLLAVLLLPACTVVKEVNVPPVPNPFAEVDMICFIDEGAELRELSCFDEGGDEYNFVLQAPL